MGVIYIGDRMAGKTHLAMESSNPQGIFVKGDEATYRRLRGLLYDTTTDSTEATEANKSIHNYILELEVRLRLRSKKIIVDWFDTPGEIWRNSWQANNLDEWNKFLQQSRNSEAIMLILSPHRELDLKVDPEIEIPPGPFPTLEQWRNRFDEWVNFFCKHPLKAKHLLICLNKADLFCHLDEQLEELSKRDWLDRHLYLYHRYFRPIRSQIDEINNHCPDLSIRCFITSVKSRPLLELPWQYLGIFLKEN
jgi:hypothetical protein